MAAVAAPLRLPPFVAPDRDFDAIRAGAIQVVVADAGATWTDHNLSDPGITLLEALAWGLADLHYRTEHRSFALAPLELPLWLDRSDRDWYGLPDLGAPGRVVGLATLLAAPSPVAASGPLEADRMAAAIATAGSRQAAIGALLDGTYGAPPRALDWDEAAGAVALLRARSLRRAALDESALVGGAWTEARRIVERRAAGGPVDEADVDTEIVRILRLEPALGALWPDELRTLVGGYRHRRFLDAVDAILPRLDGTDPTAAPPTQAGIEAALGVTADEARAVLALHPCPPGTDPETWERAGGETTSWPAHPLQALTTEPVTGGDYATRARANPRVHRAWTVAGALAGLAWDGTPRTADDPTRVGAVTVLVELDPPPPANQRRAALRDVLAGLTAGPTETAEVDAPFDPLVAPNLLVPRRVMCDELGVALVERCEVTLNGVLHVALGARRDDVLAGARARVAAYFAAGRPETAGSGPAPTSCPGGIDGPWPPIPQPAGGWQPGEPIRLHELVQVLADDPVVIGVDGVEIRVGGSGAAWLAIAFGATEAPLGPACVPVLADVQCLQVRLELGADCRG